MFLTKLGRIRKLLAVFFPWSPVTLQFRNALLVGNQVRSLSVRRLIRTSRYRSLLVAIPHAPGGSGTLGP